MTTETPATQADADAEDWVDDVPTSPKDHGFFHVGEDWEFSPGFWDDQPQT
jgi:hypothetical protein